MLPVILTEKSNFSFEITEYVHIEVCYSNQNHQIKNSLNFAFECSPPQQAIRGSPWIISKFLNLVPSQERKKGAQEGP